MPVCGISCGEVFAWEYVRLVALIAALSPFRVDMIAIWFSIIRVAMAV
ncbi:hypothetical protein [Pantoea stewartii]|nr:hypothetical protein [Pantoea stewartii]